NARPYPSGDDPVALRHASDAPGAPSSAVHVRVTMTSPRGHRMMVCVIVRRSVPSTGPVPLADPAALGPIGTPAAPTPYRPGREVEVGGVTLHVRETPGPAAGETAVYVHGLGGS